MELSPYVESLLRSLNAAAAPGGKDVVDAAKLLSGAIEPSARLSLLDAMSDAAAEITAALDEVSVGVRLDGRQIEFIVNEIGPHPEAVPPPGESQPGQSDETARVSLRLPESLKELAEKAAGDDNISVNAWLIRVISSAVEGDHGGHFSNRRRGPGRRLRGFAQS